MPRILDVLLDLAFLPSRCRITELGFEQIMADHREEASVDVALLAAPDLVDGGAHLVVTPPARHAAQQIGRASCRARVCKYVSIAVVAGSLKKTHSIIQLQ